MSFPFFVKYLMALVSSPYFVLYICLSYQYYFDYYNKW